MCVCAGKRNNHAAADRQDITQRPITTKCLRVTYVTCVWEHVQCVLVSEACVKTQQHITKERRCLLCIKLIKWTVFPCLGQSDCCVYMCFKRWHMLKASPNHQHIAAVLNFLFNFLSSAQLLVYLQACSRTQTKSHMQPAFKYIKC